MISPHSRGRRGRDPLERGHDAVAAEAARALDGAARSVGSGVALGHPEGSLHLGQVHLIREHEQWYPPQPRLAQQLVQLLPSLVEARRISLVEARRISRVDDEDDARDALGRSPRSRSRRCSLRTRCRAAVVAEGVGGVETRPLARPPKGTQKKSFDAAVA